MTRLEIGTAKGVAWADVDEARGARALLLIGHGAGGTVEAPDILAARDAALDAGVSVARVTQPYRVAGRRGMPPLPYSRYAGRIAPLPGRASTRRAAVALLRACEI